MRAERQTHSPGETPGDGTGSGPAGAWGSPGICPLPSPGGGPPGHPRPQTRVPALAMLSCSRPSPQPRGAPLTSMGLSGCRRSSRAAMALPAPARTQRRRTHRDGPATGSRWPPGGERPGWLRGPSWCCGGPGLRERGWSWGCSAGLSSERCSAPPAVPSFYPRPLGGRRVSRKENESIIPRKPCQDRPDLLSWRRQGNRRRGSAATGLPLSDSIWVSGGQRPEPKPP